MTAETINPDEAPFSFEELFFSRTDSRGIILAGNNVFQRISGYSREELLKKPHNIIRHPDMPKGVFYLLWDFLKKGNPIGAYVKNRAKSGKYYWVFAVATPIEDGYLSVRLKPSGDFFPIVQNVYKTLLAFETETRATPKESMEFLLEGLKGLGFNSYDEFMSLALSKELSSRNKQIDIKDEKFLAQFAELTGNVTEIMKEAENIFTCYETNQYVPMNLRIRSTQLGDEGKAIGVISGNFSIVSSEIKTELDIFNASAKEVFDKIYEGQFLLCTSHLQQEVCAFFRNETNGEADNSQEAERLEKQRKEYQQKAQNSLTDVIRKIAEFQENCERMKRCTASLEVIRIMGKINAARLDGDTGGLSELIDDLGIFQNAIAQNLGVIEKNNLNMRSEAERIVIADQKNAVTA